MNLAIARAGRAIALTVLMIAVSGCTSQASASPDSSPVQSDPTPPPGPGTPSPTSTPTPSARREVLHLSFGAAEDRIAPQSVDWADLFFVDDRFSVLSADDGAGSWAYLDESTQCEINFYQGTIGGLDMTQDDRTISDGMLAILVMETPTADDQALITANSVDQSIPLVRNGGEVDVRVIAGDYGDGWNFVHAVRILGGLGGGILVSVSCPEGQDAQAVYASIAEDYLRVVVQS